MTILSELHQDHVNLNKLLVILRQKCESLRAGDHPNFNLMADVISYISGYADGFHHPREDRMYEYFSGRLDQLDQKLNDCKVEHEKLKVASSQLHDTIEGVLHDSVVPMEEFADRLEAFVCLQIDHLNTEEGELFPLIEEQASEEDWKILDKHLPKPEDPLFGAKQAHEYSDLYKELIMDMNSA